MSQKGQPPSVYQNGRLADLTFLSGRERAGIVMAQTSVATRRPLGLVPFGRSGPVAWTMCRVRLSAFDAREEQS